MLKAGIITASVLVGAIVTVLVAITEKATLDAVAVTASQVVLLADGLVGDEQGLYLLLPGLEIAVLDRIFPVASLLLNIKSQTGRTTDGLETLKR